MSTKSPKILSHTLTFIHTHACTKTHTHALKHTPMHTHALKHTPMHTQTHTRNVIDHLVKHFGFIKQFIFL